MMAMSAPLKILLLALLAGALIASGYRWGSQAMSDRRDAQALVAERAASLKLLREVDRGNVAQARLGDALTAQAGSYSTLQKAFYDARKRHTALLVRAVPGSAAVAGAAGAAAGAPGAPSAGPANAPPGGIGVVPAPAQTEFVLSTGAVWMWNSALAGTDQPAGACGAADPTSPACAAATRLGVTDAWDNHAENARICAEDRIRHNHLIDFLEGKTANENP